MINEPAYGFTRPLTPEGRESLAQALELVRRKVCCYNAPDLKGKYSRDAYCDCKYGLSIDNHLEGVYVTSEATGCPELRSVIYWLLHEDDEATEPALPDFVIPKLK